MLNIAHRYRVKCTVRIQSMDLDLRALHRRTANALFEPHELIAVIPDVVDLFRMRHRLDVLVESDFNRYRLQKTQLRLLNRLLQLLGLDFRRQCLVGRPGREVMGFPLVGKS